MIILSDKYNVDKALEDGELTEGDYILCQDEKKVMGLGKFLRAEETKIVLKFKKGTEYNIFYPDSKAGAIIIVLLVDYIIKLIEDRLDIE